MKNSIFSHDSHIKKLIGILIQLFRREITIDYLQMLHKVGLQYRFRQEIISMENNLIGFGGENIQHFLKLSKNQLETDENNIAYFQMKILCEQIVMLNHNPVHQIFRKDL